MIYWLSTWLLLSVLLAVLADARGRSGVTLAAILAVVGLSTVNAKADCQDINPDTVTKTNQKPLTNDSIAKLVKEGLGEDAIINLIGSRSEQFSLAANAIAVLQKAGVSEKIISAMVNRDLRGSTLPLAPPPAAATTPLGMPTAVATAESGTQQQNKTSGTTVGRSKAETINEPPPEPPGHEWLTNDSIVKLVKAGLSDAVIISMVNTQSGKYSLSADDVIALKTAGVSEDVISAMLKQSSSAAPPSAAAASESSQGKAAAKPENVEQRLNTAIGLLRMATSAETKLIDWYQIDKDHPDARKLAGDVCGSIAPVVETIQHLQRYGDQFAERPPSDDSQAEISENLTEVTSLSKDWVSKLQQLKGMGLSCPKGSVPAALIPTNSSQDTAPPALLASARKVYVEDPHQFGYVAPGHVKKGVAKSKCLQLVDEPAQADIILTPVNQGDGGWVWVFRDPRTGERLGDWKMVYFPNSKKVEEALSCPK